MMLTDEQVNDVMQGIEPSWRYRWCSGGWCACMGGANCSGKATAQGVTKEQWERWVASNPEPEGNQGFEYDAVALAELLKRGSLHYRGGGKSITVAELKDSLRQRVYDPANKPNLP